jgi:hypothetical protein
MSNSQGDQDGDVGEDNQDEGDDDRDGNCSDGGVKSGAPDNDNAQGNNNNQGQDDDGDDDGTHCTVHIPQCPPPHTGVDGGTNPPPHTGVDGGTNPPPPPASADMGGTIP